MLLILVKKGKIMIPSCWGRRKGALRNGWGLIDLVSILVSFSSIPLIMPVIFLGFFFSPISEDHHLAQVHIGDFSKMSELVPTAQENTPNAEFLVTTPISINAAESTLSPLLAWWGHPQNSFPHVPLIP